MSLTPADTPPYVRHRYPDGHLGWFVLDYKLSKKLLADPRFSGHPLRSLTDDGGFQEAMSGPESAGDLARLDPPHHTRVRKAQTGYFTVKRVGEQRQMIEDVVSLCLDEMESHGGPVDLVEMFAALVPALVLCDMLGVPREDRVRFEELTEVLIAGTRTTPAGHKTVAIKLALSVRYRERRAGRRGRDSSRRGSHRIRHRAEWRRGQDRRPRQLRSVSCVRRTSRVRVGPIPSEVERLPVTW
jgi:cytochrome P450